MLKSIIASVVIGMNGMAAVDTMENEQTIKPVVSVESVETVQIETEPKLIELFYMYEVEHGTYWLDPLADDENVIWVDDESLEAWGISKRDLHHGEKFMGIFDAEGWELEGLKTIDKEEKK